MVHLKINQDFVDEEILCNPVYTVRVNYAFLQFACGHTAGNGPVNVLVDSV
ncbi:hypothetical protein KIN20_027836 [Parelaphostrongylus tenuis]|uniref:Uncharacterized protein n=1 Tax=Parelaphostrongylus tenuis TaxID=148309 RepID=A0AAD5R085_PARTN|nr:hypothetical protein KIN20_027836 [Parelaphostrongylus tenuis]